MLKTIGMTVGLQDNPAGQAAMEDMEDTEDMEDRRRAVTPPLTDMRVNSFSSSGF